MNVDLERLLEIHGAELGHWPAELRADAERLLATDPTARALLRARQFDDRLARHLTTSSNSEAQEEVATRRILAALVSLPQQRRRTVWSELSTALLDWDYRPAWPRIAALVGVTVLGFAIGLVELNPPPLAGQRSATAEADVAAIVFEPEPVTGSRP